MPTFIFYTCSNCNSRIETQDAYHSIGSPYTTCQKCGSVFNISKNRNEWELKKPGERTMFYSKVIFFSLWLGAGGGGVITLFAKDLAGIAVSYWVSVPIGIGGFYWMLSADLRGSIKASQERMMDPNHRRILQKLGLL